MKQQVTAVIHRAVIDGKAVELAGRADIALEFSAIDTGGGFRDPILDFTYLLPGVNGEALEEAPHRITLVIQDPSDGDNTLAIAHEGNLEQKEGGALEGMGRLQGEEASREIVKFIMRCLR